MNGASAGAGVVFAGVQRYFGDVVALAGLDLEIDPGELVALLGPSGCGKTTALRIVAGFESADAGAGCRRRARRHPGAGHKRDMGMVFQAYSLFPNMTARQNVAFGLRMRRSRAPSAARARADELLELVGLSGPATAIPHELSGGQQQRVALARALAIEPPSCCSTSRCRRSTPGFASAAAADPPRAAAARASPRSSSPMTRRRRCRSPTGWASCATDGSSSSTPPRIYRHPATPFVAQFVGAMNHVPGRVAEGGEVVVLGQRVPLLRPEAHAPGTAVEAMLRPEALEVTPDAGGPGEIRERTFLGSYVRLRVALDGGQDILVEAPSHGADLPLGARVGLKVVAERVAVANPGTAPVALSPV